MMVTVFDFQRLMALLLIAECAIADVRPLFKERSLQLGITAQHHQVNFGLSSIAESLGHGACVLDYDNDGWQDLFIVGGSGQTRFYGKKSWWTAPKTSTLYRNINGTGFRDLTTELGLEKASWGMGCVSGDLDNDGYQDILLTTRGKNVLYKNVTGSKFVEITETSGLEGDFWSTGASLADFNGDGLLDIYVSNYIDFEMGARTFEANAGFEKATATSFDPQLYEAQANQLYVNTGNFNFKELALPLGVDNASGRSLGAYWLYADDDDLPDLLVMNDKGSASRLYLNRKTSFIDGREKLGLEVSTRGHSASISDLDNNGFPDIVLSSALGEATQTLMHQTAKERNSYFGLAPQYLDKALGNKVGHSGSISLGEWGIAAADFNNDGWLDLFLASGLSTPDSDAGQVSQAQKNRLLLNGPDQIFKSVPIKGPHYSSRSAVYLDYDNDGDLDLFVGNNNELPQFFINRTNENSTNNWLGIDLVAKGGVATIGSKISVEVNGQTLYRDSFAAQTFLGQSDRRFHIGLKDSRRVEKLQITWPDGELSTIRGLASNQTIVVTQGKKGYRSIEATMRDNPDKNGFGLRPAFRSFEHEYALWLARNPLDDISAKKLSQYYFSSGTSQKQDVLNSLIKHQPIPRADLVGLLKNSLESNDKQTVLLGLKLAQIYELESSVYWMAELLNHSDSELFCAAAGLFEFFFREEEAVPGRKNIGVSPLIRQLEGSDLERLNCSINALSEVQNIQAVQAIGDIVKSSKPDNIRRMAIDALGKVHDQSAGEYLVWISTQDESIEIIAHTIIALARLASNELTTILDKHLSGNYPDADGGPAYSQALAKRILSELANSPVLSRKTITDYIAPILQGDILQNDSSGEPTPLRDKPKIRSLDTSDEALKSAISQNFFGFTEEDVRQVMHEMFSSGGSVDDIIRDLVQGQSILARRVMIEVLYDGDYTAMPIYSYLKAIAGSRNRKVFIERALNSTNIHSQKEALLFIEEYKVLELLQNVKAFVLDVSKPTEIRMAAMKTLLTLDPESAHRYLTESSGL